MTRASDNVSVPSDLRGASRLATDATVLLTHLVETMHHNIARRPGVLGDATFAPTRGITGFVYKTVRGVTRLVGSSVDASLRALQPLLGAGSAWPGRDTVLSTLNGVLGDYLEESGNPLAIELQLRHGGVALRLTAADLRQALPQATGRIALLVHGLCMNDTQWLRKAHDHGEALARDLGFTPIYVRYNSGLHVSTNGQRLAWMLESLIANWPVPVEEFIVIGHSMGGLVARSAVEYGRRQRLAWPNQLRKLVFLGTPHHGAPLERGGAWIDVLFSVSPYTVAFTHLGRLRSAGITDLRHGNLLDEDWSGVEGLAATRDRREPVVLPAGIDCYAIAGLAGKSAASLGARIVGDGLVPLASALGRHDDAQRKLDFAADRQWIGRRVGHLELLSSRRVYARLRRWLDADRHDQKARSG